MKRFTLTLCLFLSAGLLYAGGDNAKYISTMKSTLDMLDTASTMQQWLGAANKFERIGQAEKGEWLPHYYASYCYVLISYIDPDQSKLDEYLDKAESLLTEAAARMKKKKDVEYHVLLSWIHSARIGVDPMTRGAKYGGLASQELNKAEEIDSDCPRIYYLRGVNLFYTPEMWGGGKDKAKPVLAKSVEKYDIFKPASEIHPDWGKDQALERLAECDGK